MKWISAEEIEQTISMKEMIQTIEDYYKEQKERDALIPERLFINDGDNSALLMPSFFERYYAAKTIGIAPGNAKRNEPTLRGVIMLSDRETMEPLLLLDARTITAMRTGAISGLGMKYLAKNEAETAGIIGTGDQGWSHLQAACSVRPIKNVLINNRSSNRLKTFMEKAKNTFPDVTFTSASQEEILKEADIIATTSTSEDPVLPEIKGIDLTGKHFAGAGSFKRHMQEIPDYIIERADHISVDSYASFNECGEMIKAKSLGYNEKNTFDAEKLVLNGESDLLKNKVTIFKSVGIAILDILASKLVYENLKINQ